jgi:Tol biopolymer transport system component
MCPRTWIVGIASLAFWGCGGDPATPPPAQDGGSGIDGGAADGGLPGFADGGIPADAGPAGTPTITSLTPAQIEAGGFLPVGVVIAGAGFHPASVARLNGVDRPTAFQSAERLRVTIQTADLALPANAKIAVVNPAPGGPSNEVTLVIAAAVPRAASVSPAFTVAGRSAFTLRVSGTKFVDNSIVRWNGADRPTVRTSGGFLDAMISATDVASPGSAEVTVWNPAPGGGLSGVVRFTIYAAPTIERASVASGGGDANGPSESAAISADGRFVAFRSSASNLVSSDTNGAADIFVRDRTSATTTRVSVATGGAQANGPSSSPAISSNGRFVAFVSAATNLVSGDTNGKEDVFLHDRDTGDTVRASVSTAGAEADGDSLLPALPMGGRLVAFVSHATNLVGGDNNGLSDVFVRDLQAGTTTRQSVSTSGVEGDHFSGLQGITFSADGRFLFFQSSASTLTTPTASIYARDLFSNETLAASTGRNPSASANGRFLAYRFGGPFIGDSVDVYVRDLCIDTPSCAPTSLLISTATFGNTTSSGGHDPSLSADGRIVAFASYIRLSEDAEGMREQVYVRDTCRGAPTTCVLRFVRIAPGGVQPDENVSKPALAANATLVAFESAATNLLSGDGNGHKDVFVATTGLLSAPVIVTAALPEATAGTAYSAQIEAQGGTLPLSWTLASGALPSGMALSASGVISGTPAAAGTMEATVRATDASTPPLSGTRKLSIVVR